MMKAFIKKRLYYFFFISAFFVIFAFQNCSPVAVHDLVDPSVSALYGTQTAEAILGDESTIPPLKLFFVVDNSNTMAANNIELSKSFKEMFQGSEADSLSKFNTSVYLMTTANNLFAGLDSSSINTPVTRSAPVIAQYLNRNLTSWSQKSLSEVATERSPQVSGRIAGDLLGYEIIGKKNVVSTAPDDISVLPLPVAIFSASSGGGLNPSLAAVKPKGGSIVDLANDVSNRLNIINPSGYVRTVVDQNDSEKVGLIASEETGLCSIARVLKNPSRFMAANDQAAFIVISDEDDFYSHGRNCIDGFRSELAPNQPLIGTCQGKKTDFTFTYPQTRVTVSSVRTRINYSVKMPDSYPFSYTYSPPPTASSCAANYYAKLQVNYSLYPIQTRIKYFTYSVADGIKTYSSQMEKIVGGQDLTACNQSVLTPVIGSSTSVEYAAAGYTPVCTLEVLTTATPTATSKNVDYSAIKPERPALASACSPAVIANLGINPASRLAPGSCIVANIYVEQHTTSALSTGGTSTDCATTVTNWCNTSLLSSGGACNDANKVAYTPSSTPGPITHSNLSVASYSAVNCDSLCSSVSFCANMPSTPIRNYLASLLGTTPDRISACSISPTVTTGATNNTYTADRNSSLSCSSACSSSRDICPSQGSKTIQQYLQGLQPSGATVTACSNVNETIYPYDAVRPESLTCGQSCSGTLLCGSTPTMTVSEFIQSSLSNYDQLNCTATPQGNASVNISKPEELSCTTPCSTTALCAAATGNVSNFLQMTDPSLANKKISSCAASVTANAPYAVNKTGVTAANICAPGETFTPSSTNPPIINALVDYVSGTSGGSPVDLISYIQSRNLALTGQSQMMFSAFVIRNDSEKNAAGNQSVGQHYIQLAQAVGGSIYPVSAPSYAPALKDLGTVIRKKLDRTVIFKDLPPDAQIVAAWLKRAGEADYTRLSKDSQWTYTGQTVTLDSSVQFNFGDMIKINFK